MSAAIFPLVRTTTWRQQELHHYIAVCIDLCTKLQCLLDRLLNWLRLQDTTAALCCSLSTCCDGCSALSRFCPLIPMIDGRTMNLMKAIRQRWQHVIARGNKMVGGIRDDLSVSNESVHCCSYCDEDKFRGRGGTFLFSVMGTLKEESLQVVTSSKLSKMWRSLVTVHTKSFRYSYNHQNIFVSTLQMQRVLHL